MFCDSEGSQEALGRRLTSAREAIGWSQAGAARAAEVSRSTWAMWESGGRRMSAQHVLCAARALRVRTSWLLGEEPGGGTEPGVARVPVQDLRDLAAAARAIAAIAGRWDE